MIAVPHVTNLLRRPVAAARVLAGALLALLICGCASPVSHRTHQVQVEVLNTARKFEHVYLLQPGDQLEVYLHRHADLSRKVTVRSDGYISLPLVDEVKATGKSPRDLAAELRGLFGTRLKEPDVNVIVLNPPEPMVYVVGQVGTPRSLPLRQAGTLAQAVAQAGDINKHAASDSISVIRLNASGYLEAHVLDLRGAPASQPDVYMAMAGMRLQPEDLVLVPESYRSQVLRVLQDSGTALIPFFNVVLLRELTR